MGCRGEMMEKSHARRLWVPSANHGTTPYETGSLQVVSRFNVESNAWRARGGRAMPLLALPKLPWMSTFRVTAQRDNGNHEEEALHCGRWDLQRAHEGISLRVSVVSSFANLKHSACQAAQAKLSTAYHATITETLSGFIPH
jgi:hypothetical protein